MTDDDLYEPPAPPPTPGELLFEFYNERDGSRWLCELRDHGVDGVEAQFFENEKIILTRKFHSHLDPTRTPERWRSRGRRNGWDR